MTIIFHRLTSPTYFIAGGAPLLANYDMINTPSDASVGGSGVPALVDGKKSGGTNDGTYFVAHLDDATAAHFNRPASALATNTDYLDDIVQTSVPRITTLDGTAGGIVTTLALTGQIFVGESGLSNTQASRDLLVHVTDQNDNDLEVSGTKVVASLIHDGSSVNVVGTQADGFRTNASVNFTPGIPSGTAYRVWYGIRSSLSDISLTNKGAYFENQMRNVEHVSALVRSLFRQIHSEAAVNQAFDAAFDSTIRSLASAGLNERYRRSTTQPSGFVTGNYNTPGAGAIITRDGHAVEVQSATINLSSDQYPDSQLADYRAVPAASRSVLGSFSFLHGGDVGLIHESDHVMFSFTAESTRDSPAGPGFIDVIPKDIRDNLSSSVFTFINPGSSGTLNPTSGGTNAAHATVRCATGQYFRHSGKTSLRVGVDMIEVTYGGRAPETYIVNGFISDTDITVMKMNGVFADFGGTATSCTVRWLQVSGFHGGTGVAKGNESASPLVFTGRRFMHLQPAPLTTAYASQISPVAAGFFAGSEEHALNLELGTAMVWGQVNPSDGIPTVKGRLLGDGSITAVALTLSGALAAASSAISGNFSAGGNATVGGTLGVTSDITGGGNLVIANQISTTGGDIVSGDDLIAADQMICGGQAEAPWYLEREPQGLARFRDDFFQIFPDVAAHNVLYSEETWGASTNAGDSPISLILDTPKNPGQMQWEIIGGGNFHLTAGGPTLTFPAMQQMDIVMSCQDDAANTTTQIRGGLTTSPTAANGGTDVMYFARDKTVGSHWFFFIEKGGVRTNFDCGAQTNLSFKAFRLLKRVSGNVEVYSDGTLITTVLAANVPTSTCYFNIWGSTTAADTGATPFKAIWDFVDLQYTTGARQGL